MADPMQKPVSPNIAAVAERARPNWKVVPAAQPITERVQADASTPELNVALSKYFGANAIRAAVPPVAAESDLVVMEPVNNAATRLGRKVVLVQNGEITGEQG